MPGRRSPQAVLSFFRETICFMRSTTTSVLSRYIIRLYAQHAMLKHSFVPRSKIRLMWPSSWLTCTPSSTSPGWVQLLFAFSALGQRMYQVAIWGWSYGGFVTASVLAADADQSNIFKVSVFLLNQNHQRFSSSAASALPQSPTGSTTIPSTLRGCFSNIFWLKYVQCSLN